MKGVPPLLPPTPLADIGTLGWSLLGDDLPSPVAILRDDALDNNRAWMRMFLSHVGAVLAPHGKTTMSPELFALQAADGAWAMTVATAHQGAVALRAGFRRVVLANEVVTGPEIAWVVAALREPEVEVTCLVDGVGGVRRLAAAAEGRAIPVLLEVGFTGGRAGCRDLDAARRVADEVTVSPGVELRGVEAFEGLIGGSDRESGVNTFLDRVCAVADAVGPLCVGEPVLTAGGSIFADLVARRFAPYADTWRLVLRSGCYLTGDHGIYAAAFERLAAREPGLASAGLEPALEVWAAVLSRPEPTRVILGVGKRDVGTDAGLPVPVRCARGGRVSAVEGRIVEVNDQHAHLVVAPDCDLAVGDRVALGITHPCTTFDRWSVILRVDAEWRVVGAVHTEFG